MLRLGSWLLWAGLLATTASAGGERVSLIRVEGPIGPSTASYIGRAIAEAGKQEAQCLVIELDTPGGLLDSTKLIVQQMLGSTLPIVVYVAPDGATAASAGCFITLAADVAAMAPATTIGAAHPVSIGGNPAGGSEKIDDTMKQKLENYAVSYIETIAAKRNRNVEWAKASVRDSASISADTALKTKVIELIAKDRVELLGLLDGRVVGGHALRTRDAQVVEIGMILRERVFQLLWRPEIMFLLMLIAIYGIIGELSNPGAILPGVAGAIALVLALYMAAILPVNLAGVALMALAVLLFIADIYAPTHGILTVGGSVSFLIGALMLFDRADPLFRISIGVILAATVITVLFFVVVVGAGLRAQFLPVRAGRETLLGQVVTAATRIDDAEGRVFVEGELWKALSTEPVEKDQPVEIVGIDGLTLKVKPASRREGTS